MIRRCYNPIDRRYHVYGARGINVCVRWLLGDGTLSGFERFIADMGKRPTSDHSLDRIESDKDYDPDNCRWAIEKTQQRNRRNNHRVFAFGREMTLAEAVEIAKITPRTFYLRVKSGMTETEAIEKPPRPGRVKGVKYGPYRRTRERLAKLAEASRENLP